MTTTTGSMTSDLTALLPRTSMFIDGEWCAASDGRTRSVDNPATETELASVPLATAADLDRALAAAAAGFARWRRVSAWERSDVLRRMAVAIREQADRFALVMTLEQGKPVAQAKGEVLASADQFDWYADEARRIYGRDRRRAQHGRPDPRPPRAGRSRRRVRPLELPLAAVRTQDRACLGGRLLGGGDGADRGAVQHPAVRRGRRAGRSAAGVLNVVTGEPAAVSRHLIGSPVIRKVSLTGSVPVGIELARLAAEQMKAVSMELGGHAPVLVFPDADVRKAATVAAQGKFRNAGQVCIAASRFIVHESISEEFTDVFVEATRRLRLGNGRDRASTSGR